jgi:uncharacterized protein (TIGR00369 family)
MSIEQVQEVIDRGPYLSWLGLKVLSIDKETIEVRATWREEWVANLKFMQTQGGILAALIDFAADFVLFETIGKPVPTIDLRIDYHRMAKPGDLIVKGKAIKLGKQFSVCEAYIYDLEDKLIASGRGTFLMPLPEVNTKSS